MLSIENIKQINLNSICFDFNGTSQVTFEQLVDFLSQAYNSKSAYSSGNGFRKAGFVLVQRGSGSFYRIQLMETIVSDDGKTDLGFCALDTEDEIVPPLRRYK